MPAFKVLNVTHQATKTRGFFLDLGVQNGNKNMGVGKHVILDVANKHLLPECVLTWAKDGWVQISELNKDSDMDTAPAADITPKTLNPFTEANGENEFDEVPSLDDAVPARLPSENLGPVEGSTAQLANVTGAAAEERYSQDLSPIPGETPRSVDSSDDFTIKAPKSTY
jgi:hypothetical protein